MIEDCAQALGAYIKGESVGLKGNVGIYSFYATKTISTGEGGILGDEEIRLIEPAMKVAKNNEWAVYQLATFYRAQQNWENAGEWLHKNKATFKAYRRMEKL